MKVLSTVFVAFLLAGCARGHWEYPGPAAEANRLAYDCQYMANMQAKGSGYLTGAIAETQFRDCMNSRGFRWIEEAPRQMSQPADTYQQPNSKQSEHEPSATSGSKINFSKETLEEIKTLSGISVDDLTNNEKVKILASIESFKTCNKEFIEAFQNSAHPNPKTRTKSIVVYEANDRWSKNQPKNIYPMLYSLGAYEKCSRDTQGDIQIMYQGSVVSSINTVTGKAMIVFK